MNAITMENAIYDYYDETWCDSVLILGSFAESFWGLNAKPRDIDVIVVLEDGLLRDDETIYLPECGNIPINVEYLYAEDVFHMCNVLEPKLLCFRTNKRSMHSRITMSLTYGVQKSKVRKLISRSTDRAFDKGRKKLVVPDDYDPVLGLKNLYHAFKFPILAMWAFYIPHKTDSEHTAYHRMQLHIMFLNDIRIKMEEIYYSTEGTLDERSRAVIDYAKPLHNKLMSEFRILFPKE